MYKYSRAGMPAEQTRCRQRSIAIQRGVQLHLNHNCDVAIDWHQRADVSTKRRT